LDAGEDCRDFISRDSRFLTFLDVEIMSKAKMMYAFDHIPTGQSGTGGNVPTYAVDYPFVWNGATTGGGPGTGGTLSDTGGVWLAANGAYGFSGNFYVGGWLIPVNLFDLTKPRGYYGFRFKAAGPNRVNHPLVIMNSAKSAYGSVMVNINDYNWITNQEYYVEVLIDRQNNLRTVWVDGVMVINAQVFSQTILSTDYLSMGQILGTGGSSGQSYQFKDIYLMDDPGDGSVSRLGPIKAYPISIASSSGNGWGSNIATFSGTAGVSSQAKFGASALTMGATASSACSIPDKSGVKSTSTADFTIETWCLSNNNAQVGILFGKDGSAAPFAHLTYNAGTWQMWADGSSAVISAASGVAVNTWMHIALVKYQNTWYLYQNGVLLGSVAGSTFGNNSNNFVIGNYGGLLNQWQGSIDEFRISTNARYTGAFTPPSAPFTTDANTALLMHFDAFNNGYTPDASITLQSVLNTALNATTPTMPNLSAAVDGTPLVSALQSTADQGASIQGILLIASGQRAPASGTTLRTTIADQAQPPNQQTLNALQFPAGAFTYGKVLGFLANAPDGSQLTTAKVAQLSLSSVATAT
jgi:hypothetical protein